MSEESPEKKDDKGASDYMRGGKGRKDEVGKSGIYPASAPDIPADAKIVEAGELGHPKRPHPTTTEEEP